MSATEPQTRPGAEGHWPWWLVLAAAALSGVIYPFALAPYGYRILGWIALVPLMAALARSTPRTGAAAGFVWAITMGVFITDWLPPAIALYYEQPLWLGIGIFLGAAVSMVCVHFAVFGALAAWSAVRIPRVWPFYAAAAWVVAELARSRLLTGNPWGLLGYTQVRLQEPQEGLLDTLSLGALQIADIGGVYAVSFLLALANALVAAIVFGAPARSRIANAVGLVAAAGALALGIAKMPSVEETAARHGIAIVQADLDLGYRWRREHYGKNLEEYLEATRALLRENPELVVWPENAMTFFVDDRADYRAMIAATLEPASASLLAGGPRFEAQDGGRAQNRYYNSAFALSPDGSITGVYDKEHLLPFAEFFPFGSIDLLERDFGDVSTLSSGTANAPVATPVGRAAIAVCNEAMFPHVVAERVRDDADFIVNLANDGWMKSVEFGEHQLALASVRAIENRRWLVRASTSGPSAIVAPSGEIVARTDPMTAATLSGDIGVARTRTVYHRIGDGFAAGCVLFVAGIFVADPGGRRRRRS